MCVLHVPCNTRSLVMGVVHHPHNSDTGFVRTNDFIFDACRGSLAPVKINYSPAIGATRCIPSDHVLIELGIFPHFAKEN